MASSKVSAAKEDFFILIYGLQISVCSLIYRLQIRLCYCIRWSSNFEGLLAPPPPQFCRCCMQFTAPIQGHFKPFPVAFLLKRAVNSDPFTFPMTRSGVSLSHGLINFIDTKAKCRHLKNWPSKGTLRQVFICVSRLEIQSVMLVFSTIAPFPFSLV